MSSAATAGDTITLVFSLPLGIVARYESDIGCLIVDTIKHGCVKTYDDEIGEQRRSHHKLSINDRICRIGGVDRVPNVRLDTRGMICGLQKPSKGCLSERVRR